MNKRWLAVAAGAAMLLSLFAVSCGDSDDDDSAAAASPTAAAVAVATATPAPLTGSITVYTAGPEDLSKALADAFTAATNVKVELFQGNTGSVLARLDAERANPKADVVILADWSGALGLADQGLLATYQPKNATTVPAAYRDPKNQYIAQGMAALGITYNTKFVTTPPTSMADLTKPEWKDKVTMPDPAASGSVYGILAAQLQGKGDTEGWKVFTSLKANGLQVLGTNAAALAPVLTGAKYAVVGAADYIPLGNIASGESLAMVYPADGTVIAPRPMMIMKSSGNLPAAQAFLDFMLSDNGQKLVANSLIIPARTDIPVSEKRKPLSSLTALPVDWTKAIAAQQEALTRFANDITR